MVDPTMGRLVLEASTGQHGEAARTLAREVARLLSVINTPHTDEFIQAVSIEAEYQRQRWGAEGDAGKDPLDWFWLLGWLSGKATRALMKEHPVEGLHHIVSSAAVLHNWHLNVTGRDTAMRPGTARG